MGEGNSVGRQLIQNYVENYMEKVFYFCLKKTGGSVEAEDLASDISLNIIAALDKGTIPASFSAWVWKIARNRYCAWAAGKHTRLESITGADISECEIEDEKPGAEESLLHGETLSLLRRELAFISADYRDIVVAYYIEDRKIRDIAATLGLPPGHGGLEAVPCQKNIERRYEYGKRIWTKKLQAGGYHFFRKRESAQRPPLERSAEKAPQEYFAGGQQ